MLLSIGPGERGGEREGRKGVCFWGGGERFEKGEGVVLLAKDGDNDSRVDLLYQPVMIFCQQSVAVVPPDTSF